MTINPYDSNQQVIPVRQQSAAQSGPFLDIPHFYKYWFCFMEHQTYFFSLPLVLREIDGWLQDISFNQALQEAQADEIFKCQLKPLKNLVGLADIDALIQRSYKALLLKILCDQLLVKLDSHQMEGDCQFLQKNLKQLSSISAHNGEEIKIAYHRLMNSMQGPKTPAIELALFLIFLSSTAMLTNISKEYPTLVHLLKDILAKERRQVPVWSCIVTNYYLTGRTIAPEAYAILRKKYIKENPIEYTKANSHNREKMKELNSEKRDDGIENYLSRLQFIFEKENIEPKNKSTKKMLEKPFTEINFYQPKRYSRKPKMSSITKTGTGLQLQQTRLSTQTNLAKPLKKFKVSMQKKTAEWMSNFSNREKTKQMKEELHEFDPICTKPAAWNIRIKHMRYSSNIEMMKLRKRPSQQDRNRMEAINMQNRQRLAQQIKEMEALRVETAAQERLRQEMRRSSRMKCSFGFSETPGPGCFSNIVRDVRESTCSLQKKKKRATAKQLKAEYKKFLVTAQEDQGKYLDAESVISMLREF